MDDEILVRRGQGGDSEAFAALFRRYAEPVLRTAYLITGSRPIAEEVMQESFVQAFRFIGALREARAFPTWLYRTAVRLARRAAVRERRERGAAARYARAQRTELPGGPGSLETRELIWACVERLPPRQRIALVLHYYLDRPVAEVAGIMGAPVGSVKAWLHRARAALGAELGASGGGRFHG